MLAHATSSLALVGSIREAAPSMSELASSLTWPPAGTHSDRRETRPTTAGPITGAT
jgi:hypothetical protein